MAPRHADGPQERAAASTTPPPSNARPRRRVTRRAPSAFVSLYEPTGRRRWWWYSYRCTACSTCQLGRAPRLGDVAGERRAGCGQRVIVVIAPVYGRAA
jgi:hypothetical protein